jgi:hypothetical protein
MLFDRSGGILDGHVPTAKIDHAATRLPVSAVEWRLFELRNRCGQVNHHARRSQSVTLFESVITGEAAN